MMIRISLYQITPFLAEGQSLPNPKINNGTEWLRDAVNQLYNCQKEKLKMAGVQTNLFHNHDEHSGQTISRYPLIQYQKQGDQYFVTGINEGCVALETLFLDKQTLLPIASQLCIAVKQALNSSHEACITNEARIYSLVNWLPFNRENFTRYKQTEALSEKISFLEQMLRAHLVKDFSHYLNLNIDSGHIRLNISGVDNFHRSCFQMRVNNHIHDFQPFTITFTTNMSLPLNVCLGNGKVFGFGLVNPAP